MMGAARAKRSHASGLTLIELLIVMVIGGVLLMVAIPSINDLIKVQRLRSINAQVVTDLQFARAEAAARNDFARFRYGTNASMTCYVIYTSSLDGARCDCRLGVGSACTDAATREIRTVVIPRNLGVYLTVSSPGSITAFAFDSFTGGIWGIPTDQGKYRVEYFQVNALLDANRSLAAVVNTSGRTGKCAPASSTISEVAC